MSKEKVRVLELDEYEHGIIINDLLCYYNQLIDEKREFEPVVELLEKTTKAPIKKSRFKYAFEKCQEKQ